MGDLALPYVLPRIRDPDLEFAKYYNCLKSFAGRRRRDARLSAMPFDLTIDMTTACQLRCPHCATGIGSIQRRKLVMKHDVYDRVLAEAGDTCFIISYFSNGEPLLNKRFSELVASSRHQEIFSAISTNLSVRMTDATLTGLLTCGLGMIIVSLDGATAETYEQYRRRGDFNLVVDNMRRLLALKRSLGLTYPLIEWRFLWFRHNQHEEARVRALAEDWGVDLLEFWPGYAAAAEGAADDRGVYAATEPLQGPAISGPALGALAMAQVQERKLARLVPYITVGGGVEASEITPKCDWLYYSGMIYPDGRVGPCCVLSDENSDFVESIADFPSLQDVFNSQRHLASRETFVSGLKAGTACDACPNPPSQYNQSRMKTRAILRNAPDWAVQVLAADPDIFFHREDRVLVPEVEALYASRGMLRFEVDHLVVSRLRDARDADADLMLAALAAE